MAYDRHHGALDRSRARLLIPGPDHVEDGQPVELLILEPHDRDDQLAILAAEVRCAEARRRSVLRRRADERRSALIASVLAYLLAGMTLGVLLIAWLVR